MSRFGTYSNENKMDSAELHKYEIHLLKRIQDQTRIQTEHRREIEEQSKKIKAQQREIERNCQEIEECRKKLGEQRYAQAQTEQRQTEHIARIKCMSEEEKDRIYKQMIKEREDDKRDYILMYGFEKWEKWQRYKLEHDL
jgi:hypothetical protein